MFSFFRKKSELDQLTDQYRALLEESFKLSTTDRKASDLKRAEAEEVAVKMEELQKNGVDIKEKTEDLLNVNTSFLSASGDLNLTPKTAKEKKKEKNGVVGYETDPTTR